MHCLRCGAKMEGTRSFCSTCAERTQKPLESSPYLPPQVNLPNRQAAPAPKRTEPKKEGKKRPIRWILSTALLSLLCVALLLQGGWYFGSWIKTQAALKQTERERALLQQELDLLQESLAKAETQNEELQTALDRLEAELSEAHIQLVDLQQKIQSLSQRIVFLDEGNTTFHKQGCVKFRGNDFQALIRDDAIGKGYDPCELCLP